MDWVSFFVLGFVGGMFLVFGVLKTYGVIAGIDGGARAPFARRLCGT